MYQIQISIKNQMLMKRHLCCSFSDFSRDAFNLIESLSLGIVADSKLSELQINTYQEMRVQQNETEHEEAEVEQRDIVQDSLAQLPG